MTDRLPPLAAIRVFEAVARNLSFTRAAAELGMTQAAASYQIRILEERVGTPLFLRLPRQIALTEAGLRLAPRVIEAFDGLRTAFSSAIGGDDATLFISTMHTFAAQWLAPRLGGFHLAHPKLAVRLDTTDRLVDFSREEVDIAVRSGKGEWPGLTSHRVATTDFSPMLSPALLQARGPLAHPRDLLNLPLLEPTDTWWMRWFDTAGVDHGNLTGRTEASLGTQTLLASAAMAAQGVAMLSVSLFETELASGRLVQPFPITASDGLGYFLVYPETRRNTPKVKVFRDWMLAQMALDNRN
ncbi:MAG: LysR family transcriptional regulator [Devosia sp.]|nr:LysR family transcriptional regulator [Devosia sp.]